MKDQELLESWSIFFFQVAESDNLEFSREVYDLYACGESEMRRKILSHGVRRRSTVEFWRASQWKELALLLIVLDSYILEQYLAP